MHGDMFNKAKKEFKMRFYSGFVIIFLLILIIEVNLAEAGSTKIWDTKVLEKNPDGTGRQFYSFMSSLSWANKANWVQVPYGKTNYVFKGETVIENGNFWLVFHSTGFDSPFMYPNFNGTPGTVGELYGKANVNGTLKFNLYKKSVTILKNSLDEVSVMVDAGLLEGENQIVYTILKDANWFKEEPYNNYQYDFAIHSSPNRFAAAIQDDGEGDDLVVDPQKETQLNVEQHKQFYPESYRNNMILQEITVGGKNFIYMLISPDPDATKSYIDVYKAIDNSMRLGTIRGNAKKDKSNYAMYIGVLNYENIFRHEAVNKYISANETYSSSFKPSIPGRWRMSARVNSVYYTSDVYDGNFKFTSPVSGTLEVLAMYLYDRTSVTPASVSTPMDVYRNINGQTLPNVPILNISRPEGNYVSNSGFESGTTSWTFFSNGAGTFTVGTPFIEGTKAANLTLISSGANIQLYQTGIILESNTSYKLSFAAYSTSGNDLTARLIKHTSPYTVYIPDFKVNLSTGWQTFTTEFTSRGFSGTVNDGRLQFWLAPFAEAGDIYYIDDIRLEKAIVNFSLDDLNNDGVVDINDLEVIYLYIYETTTSPGPNYDINKDEKVDLYDMILVSNKIT